MCCKPIRGGHIPRVAHRAPRRFAEWAVANGLCIESARLGGELDLVLDLTTAVARVTAAGQPYETRVARVRGVDFTVFAHAPENLRAVYASGLEDHADKDFYVYQGERYSYARMWALAARCANRLRERGVGPGDRVGIALRNYPEWIAAFMGITASGAVAVALNAWWSGDELRYGMDDSGLKLLFADRERTERLAGRLAGCDAEVVAVRHERRGLITWERFVAGAPARMPEPPIAPDDNATILYTSGSTAYPKGVLSTHRAITNALLAWECNGAIAMAMNPEAAAPAHPQSVILSVPLFHVTGLAVQMLSCFRRGRKLVGMYKWDADEALRLVEAERITEFNGVPTMAWELARSPNRAKHDLSSLRIAGGGGAPMAPEYARRIDEALGEGAARTGWGMTETQGLATSIGGDAFRARPRSCGRATAPLVRVKAVRPDGSDAAPNETGELRIRGAMNFSGYWNDPEATRRGVINGWVRSGDIGHLDEEGYVYITDREKDMVLRGGENIGCQEVEAVLHEHPKVLEATVFGVPDERLGEALATVVVARPGEALSADEVRAFVAERLARFKVPTHVWFRAEPLPRTASEKIFKRAVRDDAVRRLAARGA